MSIPSTETDNIDDDDDTTMTLHDLSDTTVATQTSSSWYSVISDINANTNRSVQAHSLNTWLKICLVEPDIRLTTAQEWKLRTCMRRLLSLCDLPLKISCVNAEEFVSISNRSSTIQVVDQVGLDKLEGEKNLVFIFLLFKEQQMLSIVNPSSISQSGSKQKQVYPDQLRQLGLYLHILPVINSATDVLEVKLFECYAKTSPIIHISIIKQPRLVFHISLNVLILSLRSSNSLLELRFFTREHEAVRGYYYQWNEIKNEYKKLNINVEIDQSLMNDFHLTKTQ
ncbi:unnamed protein product [Adineta ricciae]|uniref:Uncharacterized protein n=1 Tax=Adineta ricciae TaxID=249248 RepID=A0A814T1N9_ADIRI|nr:unnamed protein product [Adineta ricciae]CAF1152156.1 unnamed protein product [Adineta ricciae]